MQNKQGQIIPNKSSKSKINYRQISQTKQAFSSKAKFIGKIVSQASSVRQNQSLIAKSGQRDLKLSRQFKAIQEFIQKMDQKIQNQQSKTEKNKFETLETNETLETYNKEELNSPSYLSPTQQQDTLSQSFQVLQKFILKASNQRQQNTPTSKIGSFDDCNINSMKSFEEQNQSQDISQESLAAEKKVKLVNFKQGSLQYLQDLKEMEHM